MGLTILRVFIKERFSLGRLFGRKVAKSKVQSFLMVVLIIYAFGVTAISNGLINYQLALSLEANNQINQLWLNLYAQLSGIGFLFGFFQAQGYLFQYKDFDLLGALPIKQSTIVTSKLLVMMIFIYLFALIIALPIYVIWWWFINPPFWHAFLFLGLFLLTPVPLMLLGSVVSFFIRRITQRWVHANVMQTIFSILFVLTFVMLSSISPEVWLSWLPLSIPNLFLFLQDWFLLAGIQTDWLIWMLYILVHIFLIFAYVKVMSGPLLLMNQNRQLATIQANAKVPNKITSVFHHFVIKESKRFFGTAIYVLNTGFGVILMLIFSGSLLIFPETINTFFAEFEGGQVSPIWVGFFILGFMLATIYTPAVSLSLEGKNFSLLKALPVQAMTIYHAKIVFNLWLMIPPTFLAVMAMAIALQLDVMLTLLLLISLVLFSMLLSLFFLFVNLWFPRFDFQHEVEVVKQSLAALIAVFGGFAWLSILGVFALGIFGSFNLMFQLLFVIGFEAILIGVAYGWLKQYGPKRFDTLTV